MPDLANVESDFLSTDILTATAPPPQLQEKELSWPEDRYVVGWNPWIGYAKGGEFESHLILMHELPGPDGVPMDVQLFARGPHKENQSVMYDEAQGSDFFRAGEGRLVKVGEKVKIQFLVSNTMPGGQAQGQANARIFSVKRN